MLITRLIPYFILRTLVVLMFGIGQVVYGQQVDHWETILAPGSSCRYFIPDASLPADWNTIDFDDAGWSEGIAGVGYGDDDDNTIEEGILSVYLRIPFEVTTPGDIAALLLDMDFDDGFVAYLNGYEIARSNLGEPGEPTMWDQLPAVDNEANLYRGLDPLRFVIPDRFNDSLLTGVNVFAVEVHNWSAGSSDLSSNPFLHAGIANANSYFQPVPDWFDPPVDDMSNLPIMLIETGGQMIPNNQRIVAQMKLIHNGSDSVNYTTDPPNQYDGQISIEVRGASSTMFPKKSYSIETQTDIGTNNNVRLLGMPAENDWVLYAPYSDKTLIRNVLSYRLYDQFGWWSPRTRYINVYLNNEYHGIYVLMEKIKQDDDRVDIMELTPEATSDIDISGGYILQIDRTNNLDPSEYWTTPAFPPYAEFPRNTFEFFDPDRSDLTNQQATYIRTWMNSLDLVMSEDNFDDVEDGYRKYMDVGSFVDYFIFHEFNKDIDAYRLSAFFYKRNDLFGGKLFAGPPWDYNLTYGNMDYGDDVREISGWLYTRSVSMYWWRRLMEDPWFRNKVYCRWEEMAPTFGTPGFSHALIDSYIQEMGSSIAKNFQRWPVLGIYVWPNSFIGATYEEEITFLKTWITGRINWLEQQWGGRCVTTEIDDPIAEPAGLLTIYPNPSTGDRVFVRVNDPTIEPEQIDMLNLHGEVVLSMQAGASDGSIIVMEGMSVLDAGVYLCRIRLRDQTVLSVRIIRH